MRWVSVLLLAAVAAHGSGQVRAPAPLGTCDVAVLDASGSPVRNLAQKDFQVTLDGAPAPIAVVSPATGDVSVVLIIDATASQPLKRYEINAALSTQWFPNLKPGDRMRVGVLAQPLALTNWLQLDTRMPPAAVAKQLVDRASAEPSPLWDATNAAIDALGGESNAKLILIVSDGRANANVLGVDEVAERAIAARVTVGTVGEGGERVLAQAGADATRVRPDASLQWLAEQTGGTYLPDGVARRVTRPQQDPFAYVRELVQTPSRPGPLLVSLTNAIRQRYRLTFPAPADGRFHRLEVTVSTPGATVLWPRRVKSPGR